MSRVVPRGRTLVSLSASTALALSVLAVAASTATPGFAAAPEGDCAPTKSLTDVAEGDTVSGLTVARGTTPAPFEGSVIGVLENGISAGLDMLIVDLDSPDIDKAGGIWSGMSGSPVYAEDGHLLGAVAYGLSYGNSKVAGVTPIDAMKRIGVGFDAPENVGLSQPQAKSIAAQSDVSLKQARGGFSQLEMPIQVLGGDVEGLAKLRDKSAKKYLRSATTSGTGGTTAAGAGAETIVAGGNLGVTLSYGDITQGGTGTVTTVCGGKVLGFGHPLSMSGATSFSMHPATALYVQEDRLGSPFKVANFGAPVGTVNQDRRAGVGGEFGAPAAGMTVKVNSSYRSRSYEGRTTVTVEDAYTRAVTSLLQFDASAERSIDGWVPGQGLVSWTMKGVDKGKPFTLTHTDRLRGYEDVGFEAGFPLADMIYAVEDIDGVTLSSVDASLKADLETPPLRINRVERWKGGKWTTVKRGSVVKAKAGKRLRLRAVLRNSQGTSYAPLVVKVPQGKKVKGRTLRVGVAGGANHWGEGSLNSVKGVRKYLANSVRGDQVAATLRVPRKDAVKVRTIRSSPQDSVIRGSKFFRLRIR